jgi:hypothetical protein
MAKNSIVLLTGDGITTTFNFSFTGGYMSQTDVFVHVGNEVDGAGDTLHRDYTWVTDGRITLEGDAPLDGEQVKIYRQTPVETAINDFSNGTVLDAGALDNGFDQLIKASQELHDAVDSANNASTASDAAQAAALRAEAAEDASEANVITSASSAASATSSAATAIAAAATVANLNIASTDKGVAIIGDRPSMAFQDNDGGIQHTYQFQSNPTSEDGLSTRWGDFALQRPKTDGTYIDMMHVSPDGVVDIPQLVFSTINGHRFNVLEYIAAEPNGMAQVELIKQGDWDAQDAAIVTAGIQKAFVAWHDTARSGEVYFQSGMYRVSGEVLGGICANGKSVARNISDTGIPKANSIQQTLHIEAGRGVTLVCVSGEYASADQVAGYYPDAVVIRYQANSRRGGAFSANFPRMYWSGSYADRYECPTGIVLQQANLGVFDFGGASPRGENFVWSGNGIIIDSCNNCQFYNIRSKAGATPLAVEIFNTDNSNVSVEDGGTGKMLADNAHDRLAAPSGTADANAYYDGMYAIISEGEFGCDRKLVKFDGVVTQADGNTALSFASGWAPSANYTDVNMGFQLPHASITDNSNVVTFENPILTAAMKGRMIMVEGYRDNDDDMGVMVAYIKDIVSPTVCTLVGSDGSDANFGETKSRTASYFGAGVAICNVYRSSYAGKNDDVYFYGLVCESGGGCQLFVQAVAGMRVFGSKGHGRADNGDATYRQDFSRTGLAMAFDNAMNVSISGTQFDWAGYIDVENGTTVMAKVTGNDNQIAMYDHWIWGSNDKMDLICMKDAGVDSHVTLSGGANRFAGWKATGTEHNVVAFNSAITSLSACFHAGTPIINRWSGSRTNQGDMLEPYRHILTQEYVDADVPNKTIAPQGSKIIRIRHSDASAEIDTIEGLPEGFSGILVANSSANEVVLRTDTGNIQAPTGVGSVTLARSRDSVQFYVLAGYIRIAATAI